MSALPDKTAPEGHTLVSDEGAAVHREWLRTSRTEPDPEGCLICRVIAFHDDQAKQRTTSREGR